MEKDRSSKIMAVVAMFIAVVGLSLGFAAFTRTLTIESTASVNPSDTTFSVKLSSKATEVDESTESITPAVVGSATGATEEISISNSATPTISGLGATFTKPNSSVTYTFYAVNDGEFDAYLKNINIANVASQETAVYCTADAETDATMVAEACKGIEMTITVDDDAIATATTELTSSKTGISEKKIVKPTETKSSHTIKVKLEYKENSKIADGKFSVKFGNVSLEYKSQDK